MFLEPLMEAIAEDVRIVILPSSQQSHPSPGQVDHEFLEPHASLRSDCISGRANITATSSFVAAIGLR